MAEHAAEAVLLADAPGGVVGAVRVPASKSLTQRALVAAALAGGGATVRRALDAEDPRLLFAALQTAGFDLAWHDDTVVAHARRDVRAGSCDLGNNGTGARFVLAQLARLPGRWRLDGSPRLRERPVAPLVGALRELGADIREPGAGDGPGRERWPLEVAGRTLEGGAVRLDPSASSQFVSALMLLGAALPAGVEVRLLAPPPSRPYLELTTEVLEAFGAVVTRDGGGAGVATRGPLRPCFFDVEGDWSAAAFPLAAVAAAGGEVEVLGVRRDSRQGDAAVLRLLAGAGCTARWTAGGVALRGPATRRLEGDLGDTPDLFPALAVVVATHGGALTGLGGLAAKESDRLAIMTERLTSLGFAVRRGRDAFASDGGRPGRAYDGPALDPAADHRIAMATAVAGCVVPGVRLTDPATVGKSWPGFWSAWRDLLGRAP